MLLNRPNLPSFDQAKEFIVPFGPAKNKRIDDTPLLLLDWYLGRSYLSVSFRDALDVYLSDPAIAKLLQEKIDERGDD